MIGHCRSAVVDFAFAAVVDSVAVGLGRRSGLLFHWLLPRP